MILGGGRLWLTAATRSPQNERVSLSMAVRILLSAILAFGVASAQQKTASSNTRPGVNDNATGEALEGARPTSVLKIVKTKGFVKNVDLQKRTVTIAPAKGESLVLAFSQPAGREQLKTGKKAAKRLGKKRLRLEELESGSKVRAQYYPLLAQLMELVVE